MATFSEPRVFLVGAGAGSAGLLTVRAVEVLALADLVIYDQLVPKRLLDFVRAGAEAVCVRELPGNHPEKYPVIFERMIEAAHAGKIVVRLKGGDPLLFGRGGEEAEAMREARIPYEIVPGVTAALAAAAFLDIPITHRMHSSALALITGHELPAKPGNKLDYSALAKFPGTLAIYMGMARLPLIVAELLKYGKNPNTPCAVIERASTGDMRSCRSTLMNLDNDRRAAGLEAPGLILIGEVIDQTPEKSWYEQLPLFGRRVLVTRPRHQAEGMVRRLENLGAVPVVLPTVEIRPPSDTTHLDEVLNNLNSYDWLVFTSTNGVKMFFERLLKLGKDLRALGKIKLACIGAKTAEALKQYHLNADVVPDQFWSEGLVASLRDAVTGKRVLLARANRGRAMLKEEFSKIANVTEVTVYDQVDSVDVDGEVFSSLRRGEIEFLTFSSSNIARSLLTKFDATMRGRCEAGQIKIVAISPETAKNIAELGFPVHATASTFTADGLIEAVVRLSVSEQG